MQAKSQNNVLRLIANDLTYNRVKLIDFLRKNGFEVSNNSSNEDLAGKLYDFISASDSNAQSYSYHLTNEEYRYIEPITIAIIASTIISTTTGVAGAVRQGKAGRQQASRYEQGLPSLEEVSYEQKRESRRRFLTNLFQVQQEIILEDEKYFRQAQNLKKISIGFLVLTLILGGVWLVKRTN